MALIDRAGIDTNLDIRVIGSCVALVIGILGGGLTHIVGVLSER